MNLRTLDVGTANTISLPKFSPPTPNAPTPAAAPAEPVGRSIPGGAAQPAPPAAGIPVMGVPQAGAGVAAPVPGPAASPAAGGSALTPATPTPGVAVRAPSSPAGVILSFNPQQVNTQVGKTFMMDVQVSGAQNLFTVPVQLQYDPAKLELLNISNASFLAQGEQPVALAHREDSITGTVQVTANRPPNSGGVSGQGPVFTLTFMAKSAGQATISITRAGLKDANNQNIAASGTQGVVQIAP